MEEHRTTRIKGRVKEVTGWATGDRRVEAEGLVEAVTGHEPDPDELQTAEHAVRVAHGDIAEDGRAVLDERQLAKQPDWSYEEVDSGKAPVDRLS